jgi:hypothetical protein
MNRTILRRFVVLLLVAIAAPRVGLGDEERLKGAYRFEREGWVFVHLEGTPERIGFQHGYLLAHETEDLLRVLGPYLKHTTKRDWAFYRDAAERMLWPKIEDEYRRELDGIVAGLGARGVKADRWDVVALNAVEELPYYYVPWLDKKEGKAPTAHAPGNCSAFIATGSATKDGRIVMGHNAWTNYVVGTRWNIVFDIKPSRGHRVVMDSLPGVIASDDDFGLNDAGIVITETTITQFEGWDPEGVPEFVRARKAMQYSESIDDFARIMLEGNNGGYANDWLVGDLKTDEIARLELGLKEHLLERTRDGYYVGSNFPIYEPLIKTETKFDPSKKDSSPNARRARWERLMAEHHGTIDLELAKRFETDTRDAITGLDGANDRTLLGAVEASPRGVPEWDWAPYFPGGTVQSKVLDARCAGSLSFLASFGHPGAPDFLAADFLKARPEYSHLDGLLKDLKARPWTKFGAGMKK